MLMKIKLKFLKIIYQNQEFIDEYIKIQEEVISEVLLT
jgi:hypothetical protein